MDAGCWMVFTFSEQFNHLHHQALLGLSTYITGPMDTNQNIFYSLFIQHLQKIKWRHYLLDKLNKPIESHKDVMMHGQPNLELSPLYCVVSNFNFDATGFMTRITQFV